MTADAEPLAGTAGTPEPSARAFSVSGLGTGGEDARALERRLRGLPGVAAVHVSPRTALAYVDFVPAQVTEEQLADAIRDAGYQVSATAQRFDWRHRQQEGQG